MTALPVETVDTTLVPPADRFPLWLDMADRISAPVAFTSDHADDFRGQAQLLHLGGVAVTRFHYQSLVGRRTPKLIRQADPEVYQIALAMSGTCAISARRRETAVPVGDFTLIDWGRPHDLAHAGDPDGAGQASSSSPSTTRSTSSRGVRGLTGASTPSW